MLLFGLNINCCFRIKWGFLFLNYIVDDKSIVFYLDFKFFEVRDYVLFNFNFLCYFLNEDDEIEFWGKKWCLSCFYKKE